MGWTAPPGALVINKSAGDRLKASFSIAGFQPEPGAATDSYGIPQDEAALTGTGSPDIAQASFTGAAAEFPCKFPPYSATLIVLSPLRRNLCLVGRARLVFTREL